MVHVVFVVVSLADNEINMLMSLQFQTHSLKLLVRLTMAKTTTKDSLLLQKSFAKSRRSTRYLILLPFVWYS